MKDLIFWSVTLGEHFNPLPSVDRMKTILDEFCKQWMFQEELGAQLGGRHYQIRIILPKAESKATLLSIFGCRIKDIKDITFLPESNKSIEQGGLAFYVMKDDTRVAGPWSDPSYSTPRSRDWVPDMCKDIVDNPRPWMTTLNGIIEGPPSHRSILWICTLDGLGGVGKSLWNTWFEASGLGCWVGDGTPVQIKEAVCLEGERRAYSCDMPKTFAHDNRIGDYINTIETIKNGFIKTSMHGKRKKLVMNMRPHFIVFANTLPPYHMLTDGRIVCYTIDPKLPKEMQSLDLHRRYDESEPNYSQETP